MQQPSQETRTTKLWPMESKPSKPTEQTLRATCSNVKEDRRAIFLPFHAIDVVIYMHILPAEHRVSTRLSLHRLATSHVCLAKFYDNSPVRWEDHSFRFLGLVPAKHSRLNDAIMKLVDEQLPALADQTDELEIQREGDRSGSREGGGSGICVFHRLPDRRALAERVKQYYDDFNSGAAFPEGAEMWCARESVYDGYQTETNEPVFRFYFGESSVVPSSPDPLKEPLMPRRPVISPSDALEARQHTREVEFVFLDYLAWQGQWSNLAGANIEDGSMLGIQRLYARILMGTFDTRTAFSVVWSWVAWRLGYDKRHIAQMAPGGIDRAHIFTYEHYETKNEALSIFDADRRYERLQLHFLLFPIEASRLFGNPVSAVVFRVMNTYGETVAAALVDVTADVPVVDTIADMAVRQADALKDRWPHLDVTQGPAAYMLLHQVDSGGHHILSRFSKPVVVSHGHHNNAAGSPSSPSLGSCTSPDLTS